MKALKIAAIVVLVYVGSVVTFESVFGYFQPTVGPVLVITTFDRNGSPHDRVLSRLQSDDQLYVATNHWTRGWYNEARENPDVQITLDGDKGDYRAVPVTGAEHDRMAGEHHIPLVPRALTGFAPRHFLRLDPR
jgi:hypothetical protein